MNNVNKMRRGFTMIELIFVIVIIGILAAVAIPKLSATRDDAKVAQIVANLRTFTEDVKDFYLANGENVAVNANAWTAATWDMVTDTIDKTVASGVTTGTIGAAFNLGNATPERCFTVTELRPNANINNRAVPQRVIQVTDGPDAATTICVSALALANARGLHITGGTDNHIFAGQGVTF